MRQVVRISYWVVVALIAVASDLVAQPVVRTQAGGTRRPLVITVTGHVSGLHPRCERMSAWA